MTTNQTLRDALRGARLHITGEALPTKRQAIDQIDAALATADADQGSEPQRCDFGNPEDFNEAHTDWMQEQHNAEVGALIYNGNTVSYMYSKAKNYGDVVLAAHKLIGKPGHVLDTLKALITERDALAARPAPVGAVPAPTVGWLIEWTSRGGIKEEAFHRHNCVADYRAMYGEATACELVRGAAAPAAPIVDNQHCILMADKILKLYWLPIPGFELKQKIADAVREAIISNPCAAEHAKPEPVDQAKKAEGFDTPRFREILKRVCGSYGMLDVFEIKVSELLAYIGYQAGQQAGAVDGERLRFAMQDIDSFGNLLMDKYDYAIQIAEANGRDVPSADDELNGIRALIDAAIASATQKGE